MRLTASEFGPGYNHVTIDGHDIEPLANGGCYVTTDGIRTFHNDQAAAMRHIERMAGERAQYEARRGRERR